MTPIEIEMLRAALDKTSPCPFFLMYESDPLFHGVVARVITLVRHLWFL